MAEELARREELLEVEERERSEALLERSRGERRAKEAKEAEERRRASAAHEPVAPAPAPAWGRGHRGVQGIADYGSSAVAKARHARSPRGVVERFWPITWSTPGPPH